MTRFSFAHCLLLAAIVTPVIAVRGLAAPDTNAKVTKTTVFNLSFNGGSVERFIAQLQRDSRTTINVVMSPEAKRFQIDELKLRSVTVQDVIAAVGHAYDRLELRQQGTITVLSLKPLKGVRFRMFQLKDVLKETKIEDINTLIRNAWELMHIGAKAKLRYHPQTKILIVAGLPAEIEAVDAVLAQLAPKEEDEN